MIQEGKAIHLNLRRNLDLSHDTVEGDHRISIEKITDLVDILHAFVFLIIHDYVDLSMLSASRGPKSVARCEDGTKSYIFTSLLIKMEASEDYLIKQHVTGGKTWIHQYDPGFKV